MGFAHVPLAIATSRLSLFHKWEFCTRSIRELVQKFDGQARIDQRCDDLTDTVIPNIKGGCFTLVVGGVGTGHFDWIRLLRVEIWIRQFDFRLVFCCKHPKHGMIIHNIKDAARF